LASGALPPDPLTGGIPLDPTGGIACRPLIPQDISKGKHSK